MKWKFIGNHQLIVDDLLRGGRPCYQLMPPMDCHAPMLKLGYLSAGVNVCGRVA
ncbi:MAG: hypothetical protein VCA55_11720 [Verrucomicrobiales bacterium]